ncbi:TetR/AcrR family transcriptional regulator [Amorphus coralli]|uniref:TetR/AcrR family transcriptional regulator n=1 Tax=Amorphus coralli TaxID=340680 RepID=UPI000366803E|nr:TetR/AcrR family transcriptional regulator [Amorphus coralli]
MPLQPRTSPGRRPSARAPAATPARPRGRPKLRSDDEQRDAIIQAANDLFVAHGYDRTTMDDVAARCGISKRTLYRLFPSKSELFASLIRAHRSCLLALPGDYDDMPIDRALERILRADLAPSEERQRHAILRLVRVESAQHPELGDILVREGGDQMRSALAAWLAGRAADGSIRLEEPEVAAHILLDMVFGTMVIRGPDDPLVPKGRDRAAHVRRCIAIFLHGVARDPISQGHPGQL